MKYYKYKIDSKDIIDNKIEIVCLGDIHLGDNNCDYALLDRQIDYINNNQNVFVIGIGDYMNNALKLSKTDVYSAIAPQKEFQMAVEILGRIKKSKWIAMTTGNHEHRTYREAGVDLNRFLAYELGIEDDGCREIIENNIIGIINNKRYKLKHY